MLRTAILGLVLLAASGFIIAVGDWHVPQFVPGVLETFTA